MPYALFGRQRNQKRDAILGAYAARDMTLAGDVFCQEDMSRVERDNRCGEPDGAALLAKDPRQRYFQLRQQGSRQYVIGLA